MVRLTTGLTLALLALGCGGKKDDKPYVPPTKGKLDLKITYAGPGPTMDFDIVTDPGATLRCYYPPNGNTGVTACAEVTADAAGKAHLTGSFPMMASGRDQVMISGAVYGEQSKSAQVNVDISNGELLGGGNLNGNTGFCLDHSCSYEIKDGKMSFTRLEAGATVELAGQKAAADADGNASLPIPVDALLAKARLGERGNLASYLAFAITWKDGSTIAYETHAEGAQAALDRKLLGVRSGGVVLPGDDATPLGTAVYVVSTDPHADLWIRALGTASSLHDLGLVAVVDAKSKKKKTCGPYGSTAKLEMTFADADVTVYERASGKVRAHKKFGGSHACPKEIMVHTDSDHYNMSVEFDLDLIDKWLTPMAK